jgi:hypothetical protein
MRDENPELLKKRERRKYDRNAERYRARARARAATPHGRAINSAAVARYTKAHPERVAAQRIAAAAEKRGEIKRSPVCQVRGCNCRDGLHRHHPSYARPKDVVYVCRSHHEHIHHRGALTLKAGSGRKYVRAPKPITASSKRNLVSVERALA